MHAPDPGPLTCLSCGYDLRAAARADEKCPECGFPVRDSIAGQARVSGRWAWRVRVGMLLMLIAALLLVAQMLGAGEADRVLLLNFAGVKAWGAPLRRGDSLAAGVVVNALGLFLLTTPDGRRERSMSLRRWLRVYVIAAVTASGFIASRHFDWLLIEGYSYDEFLVLLLAETPGTVMLYLYLAHLAREHVRDPDLARRSTAVLKGAVPLLAVSIIVFAGGLRFLPIPQYVLPTLLVLYVVAVVSVGLWAADVCLDLYRALAAIERDASRG